MKICVKCSDYHILRFAFTLQKMYMKRVLQELIQGGAAEHCIAILNNFYNDGVHWHDVACHHRKPFVCEENDALLKYVRYTNPNLRV